MLDLTKLITPEDRAVIDAKLDKHMQLMELLAMSQEETENYGVLSAEEKRKRKLLPPPTQREITSNPEDFLAMPKGGFARRCKAKARSTQKRCRHVAKRGKLVCKFHGALSSGPKTVQGKANSGKNLRIRGCEGVSKRERDRAKARWFHDIERLSKQLGFMLRDKRPRRTQAGLRR